MSYSLKIENQSHAVQATIDYLGAASFAHLVCLVRGGTYTTTTDKLRTIKMIFGVNGVRGYHLHHHLFRHVFK